MEDDNLKNIAKLLTNRMIDVVQISRDDLPYDDERVFRVTLVRLNQEMRAMKGSLKFVGIGATIDYALSGAIDECLKNP